MVYTELTIVIGAVVSFEDLKNIFEVEDPYELDSIHDELNDKMELLSFNCCSKSANKLFIIGYTLHTYYRNYVRCEDCGERTVCDKCIGHTNNGYYDVQSILDGPTEVPIRNVCFNCFADNCVDMKARSETVQIVDNRYVFANGDEKHANDDALACKVCNNKFEGYKNPTDTLKQNYKYQIISKFLNTNNVESEPKLYYLVNDCLSCT